MNIFKRRNNIILLLFLLFIIIFNVDAYVKDEEIKLTDNNIENDLSLLISTLDGGIYSFNYESGSLNWAINSDGDSLYTSSQFSNSKTTTTTTTGTSLSPSSISPSSSLLIPSLDGSGSLFQYTGDTIQKVPFSIQDLVNSSPLFLKETDSDSDEQDKSTMFIGNKKTSITVVDSKTGEVIKSMSKDGFWMAEDGCPTNIPDDALLFTRSDYQVIALDPKSGLEKWNLSIGEYIPHSTKSFYNSDDESLIFEGSIEVGPISQHRYKLYIRKPKDAGASRNYWECILSSSPVSIYAYSNTGNILKKLEFNRRASSLLPPSTTATDLIVPSKFDQTFMFDNYNGQFFIINNNKKPQPQQPQITDNSNNNNNKNNQISDNKNIHNNNIKKPTKINDIYLYTSIVVLITSVIVFIRSRKSFNLINLNNNANKQLNNNNNNKKTPKKKKKKQKNNGNNGNEDEENENENELIEEFLSTNSVQQQVQIQSPVFLNNNNGKIILENGNVKIGKLEIITSKVLGTGSCGTVVYEGFMEGRKVAVKRMLAQFVKFADREVSILIHSDEHTNVVRYFAKEEDGEFIYLAISFCKRSLDNYVQQLLPQPTTTYLDGSPILKSTTTTTTTTTTTNVAPTIILDSKTKQMIFELFKGLEHLHSLNIVHRDIKPHNILIDPNNRVKISDMGLGKLLDNDDASLTFTSDSHGWQPAEYLNGTNRNTKKVDIFSIGCVVYYLLTGVHPFGHRYNREKNVLKGKYDIDAIVHLPYIHHLVSAMINYDPDKRPDITDCINHPFFWEYHKKLSFLVAASDYLEFEKPTSPLNIEIDSHIDLVTEKTGDWWLSIDQVLIDNIGRYRKYNGKSIRDLLRVIRNKFNHYRDLSADEQQCLGPLPDGFFNYFDSKFPKLFITTYLFVVKNLKSDQYFVQYFS